MQGAPILLRSSTSLQKRERTICLSLLAHWLIPGFHIFSSDRGEMQFSTGSSVEVHNFIVIRNLSVRFPLMQTVLIIKQTFDSSLWVPVISATNDYSPICSWVCLKANDEYWFTLLRHEIFFLLPLPSLDGSFANVVTVCFLKYWNYTAERRWLHLFVTTSFISASLAFGEKASHHSPLENKVSVTFSAKPRLFLPKRYKILNPAC